MSHNDPRTSYLPPLSSRPRRQSASIAAAAIARLVTSSPSSAKADAISYSNHPNLDWRDTHYRPHLNGTADRKAGALVGPSSRLSPSVKLLQTHAEGWAEDMVSSTNRRTESRQNTSLNPHAQESGGHITKRRRTEKPEFDSSFDNRTKQPEAKHHKPNFPASEIPWRRIEDDSEDRGVDKLGRGTHTPDSLLGAVVFSRSHHSVEDDLGDKIEFVLAEKAAALIAKLGGSFDAKAKDANSLLQDFVQFDEQKTMPIIANYLEEQERISCSRSALSLEIRQQVERVQKHLGKQHIHLERVTARLSKARREMEKAIGGINTTFHANSADIISEMQNEIREFKARAVSLVKDSSTNMGQMKKNMMSLLNL
ncbi:hypothetical protein DFJ73DRAFT_872666 [Zopfochytrium polystomum]|nr:hypothetical protein DFJ73DRAFT_872666 [Zopfochytrium polystomum]